MRDRLTVPLVLLALLAAPSAAGLAWPMENADAPNTNQLGRPAPEDLSGFEETNLGSDVITQVVEGPAGLALAGTLGGKVLAITATGEVAWRAEVPGEVRTAPAWTGEHVIVVPRAKKAIALTPSGERAWTVPVENARSSATVVRMASPVVHPDGGILVADMEGHLIRLTDDGETVWRYDIGGERAIEATPAVAPGGDVVVAGFVPGQEGAGKLVRVDGDTGSPVWTRSIGSQVVGAPAITGQRILLPLRDGDAVQSRSLADGSLQWEVAFDDHVVVSPAVWNGIAIAGDIRGVLRGIDVESGDVEWTFSPLQDDPNIDHVDPGSALTVADSPAIDGRGRAWVAYWNADMTTCCPPTDSKSSPFYLLDAETGEMLDRTRFPKAAHGPALHATGVWVGTDEDLVRRWPTSPTLQVEAFADGSAVTLVTNTDRSGGWAIDWGPGGRETGDGRPPVVASHTLPAGNHTLTVTVGDATAEAHVSVADQAGGNGSDPDAGSSPRGTDANGSASGGAANGTGNGSTDAGGNRTGDAQEPGDGDAQPIPTPVLALLVALIAAAGGRRRG